MSLINWREVDFNRSEFDLHLRGKVKKLSPGHICAGSGQRFGQLCTPSPSELVLKPADAQKAILKVRNATASISLVV